LTDIYVDGDACPVREEIYRVATRLQLNVLVVSNGSRPIRPPGTSNVSMVLVGDSADAADDWIAEHISAVDVCVTSDIPLASRCLKKGARVVSPTGKQWTEANIGNALAGRDIARHLRELGENTRGPAALTKQDRSRFKPRDAMKMLGAARQPTANTRNPAGKSNRLDSRSANGLSTSRPQATSSVLEANRPRPANRRHRPDTADWRR
jgi:uncharacterized protein YaiI (UPF0178 family)